MEKDKWKLIEKIICSSNIDELYEIKELVDKEILLHDLAEEEGYLDGSN